MKVYNINSIEDCKRCINWLKDNKYKPFVMQHDWYDKEGFIMYLYNESGDIEIHTRSKDIQEILIGYMVEFNKK